QQIAAVEQESRIDVPRHAIELALDDVGVPDSGKVVAAIDRRRARDVSIQRLESTQRDEFRDPGVAQLADVGRGVSGKSSQEFFMRGAPWELLDVDPDAGMRSLELGNKRGDDLAFATHGPEA